MNIFNLGRRYLWSHLLFGMVVAGLGLSTNVVASTQQSSPLNVFFAIKASYAEQNVSIQPALQVSPQHISKNYFPTSLYFLNNPTVLVVSEEQNTGLWIATSLGIRAGPDQSI